MGLTRVCVMNFSLSFEEEHDILPVPHHPNKSFKFPKCSFGKTKIVERSFQPSWFVKWPFLHCNEVADRVFCHTCMKAFKENKMKSTKKADPAFGSFVFLYNNILCSTYIIVIKVINGYYNWKDATIGFQSHELSGCHQEAVKVIITLPNTTMNIGAHLSNQYVQEKELNRKMLILNISMHAYVHFLYVASYSRGGSKGGQRGQMTPLHMSQKIIRNTLYLMFLA